jgi:hypothetical protein
MMVRGESLKIISVLLPDLLSASYGVYTSFFALV